VLRFRDIAGNLSRVAVNHLLHLHLTVEGVTPVEFGGDLWRQKTTVPGLLCGTVSTILSLAFFRKTPTCDRLTHEQTRHDRIYTA